MPLSKTQKLLRARTLGTAVKRLREELGLSQEGLADAIGHKLDGGMISRWERAADRAQYSGRRSGGACSPSPEWRKFLANFARRRGCWEAAAAFDEPMHEWKVMLSADERRMLTLFEIIVLNRPGDPEVSPPAFPPEAWDRLVQAIEDAAADLKKSHRQKFAIMGTKDWAAWTLTDEQRVLWMRETNPRARKLMDGEYSGDTVVFEIERRVCHGKAKKGAR